MRPGDLNARPRPPARAPAALRALALVLVGALVGLVTAAAGAYGSFRLGGEHVGAWTTNTRIGSSAASPWLRAAVALGGFLALDRRETLYYAAFEDDAGRGLSRRCRYRVEGPAPEARWWSITVYAADGFLLPNRARRYSFGSADADPAAGVSVELAPRSDDPSVVPLGDAPEDSSFSLTLRLYEPSESLARDPSDARLPRIRRLSCD